MKVSKFKLLSGLCGLLVLGTAFLSCSGSSSSGGSEPDPETKYTVSFDADNGSAVQTAEVISGEAVSKPADPTKTGYTFKDWYNGSTKYDFSSAVTGNISLKAKWEIVNYSIKYMDGATELTGKTPSSYTVQTGSITLPAASEKAGFTFVGWSTSSTATSGSKTTMTVTTGDIVLYAIYTDKTIYTVTFDSNGGSAVENSDVISGEAVTKPTDPTKTGYTFDGWYNGSTKYNFSTPVTGALNLTAQWTINSYDVTFNSNGGSTVAKQTVNYGSTATEPADPTKEGYTFDGWYNGSTKYDFSSTVTGALTLTAKWILNVQVTVTLPSADAAAGTPTLTDSVSGTSVTVTCSENYSSYKWYWAKAGATSSAGTGKSVTLDISGKTGINTLILEATDSNGKIHSAVVTISVN